MGSLLKAKDFRITIQNESSLEMPEALMVVREVYTGGSYVSQSIEIFGKKVIVNVRNTAISGNPVITINNYYDD